MYVHSLTNPDKLFRCFCYLCGKYVGVAERDDLETIEDIITLWNDTTVNAEVQAALRQQGITQDPTDYPICIDCYYRTIADTGASPDLLRVRFMLLHDVRHWLHHTYDYDFRIDEEYE